MTYYYTTTPTNPTQNRATVRVLQATPLPSGLKIFMPAVMQGVSSTPVDADVMWVTQNVPAGEYYICATANDGYNSPTYCSDAPVKVVP
jgi:hypothetical protein